MSYQSLVGPLDRQPSNYTTNVMDILLKWLISTETNAEQKFST